jgi:hypothetical protein
MFATPFAFAFVNRRYIQAVEQKLSEIRRITRSSVVCRPDGSCVTWRGSGWVSPYKVAREHLEWDLEEHAVPDDRDGYLERMRRFEH